MNRKWPGAIVALTGIVGLTVVQGMTAAVYARTSLVQQRTSILAPRVAYMTLLDTAPRNVIHVTRVSAGAPAVIKAVPAPADATGVALAPVTALCQVARAVACVNGDFFGPNGAPLGGELVDGKWARPPTPLQQQVWLDAGNRFSIGARPRRAVQSLGATKYAILVPGQPISIPEHDAFAEGAHARTLLGWNDAGDRFLVTVEQGRGSHGMSLAQAADLMQRLGATTAVNEDGGESSQMVAGGVLQGDPGQRPRPVANIWAVVA